MQLQCSSCLRVLEYSGTPPVCCAHCGRPLNGRPTPSPNPFLTPRLDPADDGPVPETVGGYRLLRSLGAGGMGTVYEAEETASGRHVALKLLKPQAAASPESLERFRREGRLASQIAHPRCVFVYAADQEEGRPYIVMELMPGDTLADLVARQGPLAPGQAVATILDVIDGLQEAHQLGVIHRDVKPSNCFLLPDGRVKIGDFGLAKSLFADSDLTRTGTFLGTPYFASPEQVSDDPVDFRTDIYSVAATLYFLLTGQAPFQRKGNPAAVLASIVSKPPPSARELRPEVPPALDRVLRRGLERNPARRWKNLEAFRAALLPFAPGYRPFAALGIRLGAWLIDAAWFVPLWLLTGAAAGWRAGADGPGFLLNLTKYLADAAVWVAYFTLFEWLGGATLGKRFLGLRVRRPNGHDRPGLPRALLRALLFWAAFFLPADALGLFQVTGQAWSYLSLGLHAAGALLLASTMRAANGYRGLHELASGTCVVAVPRRQRRRLPESKRPDRLAAARNRR
ncbi:MAG TPA: protein kinase, partial [Gemmataceae bacterium]|nr:protein kinase [Gemmataceae bacterium]